MPTTVFDVLIKQIEEQKLSSTQFLISGGPKDFSQYKEVTGLIRGLEVSKQLIEDLSRNQMEEDND
ncbi:hypothetical protein N9869_01690 [Algibacter sp.]|jgi:hypothetical protein|nr:hypothetical protein [Algibacter sp.]MDB4274015.1 hypothetical protein [Algibacter sp.]